MRFWSSAFTVLLILFCAHLAEAQFTTGQTPIGGGTGICLQKGGYPWEPEACLNAPDLNEAMELSVGGAPPYNVDGLGAGYGKLWIDSSASPPRIRQCQVMSPGRCSNSYVSSEWVEWGALDSASGVIDWPIGGGTQQVQASAVIDVGLYAPAVLQIVGSQTNIVSFGPTLKPGRVKILQFPAGMQIIASATMLTPGGANVTTISNQFALVAALGNSTYLVSPFGSLGSQNANAVQITGGRITGMPTPTNPTDVSTKGYSDAIAAGVFAHAPVQTSTTAALPNSPTYFNGPSNDGVSSRLTAATNGALTLDGYVLLLNDSVLVNNQAAPAQNGIYTQIQLGTSGTPYILQRRTDADHAANGFMQTGLTTLQQMGTHAGTTWNMNTVGPITMGTTGITFVPFLGPPNPATVSTNLQLKSLSSMTNGTAIYRAGFSAPGDGGAAFYTFSATNCSLNSGAGDNGSQVSPTSGSGCWNADFHGQAASAQIWGACLGGSDDTGALNAALAVVTKVSLPPKTCTVAGTITVSASQSELAGSGRGMTVLRTSSPTLDLISVATNYVSIHDLELTSTVTRTAGCFVNLLSTASAPLVYNFNAFSPFRGICYNTTNTAVVRDGDIANIAAGGDGVYVNGCYACTLGPGIVINNPAGAQPKANVHIVAAGDFTLLNVHTLHGGDCLLVDPTAGNSVQSLRITNSWNDSCGQHAVYFNAQGGSIQRVDAVQSWFATAQLEGVKMSTSGGGTIDAIAFAEPHIFNNGLATSADQFLVADSGVSNVQVTGGYIANNANSIGMHFGIGVAGFTVHQVKVGTAGGFVGLLRALQIDASATNFVVTGNDFSGNANDVTIAPPLDGYAAIMHDNLGTGIQSPYVNDTEPTAAWSLDTNSALTGLNNGATLTLAGGGGLLIIANDSNGDQGLFLCGGGTCNLLSSTGGTFVVGGLPAAGKIGVTFAGGTQYKIVSNFGTNVNIRTMLFRTRTSG